MSFVGVHFVFGPEWNEIWVPDVGGACVMASSIDEAMADITSQLEACLEDYTDTGRDIPPASDEAKAMVKAADMLKDFQVEMPGAYPQPTAQHVVVVTCELMDGRDRWGGGGGVLGGGGARLS